MKGGRKQLSLEGFDFSKEKNLTKIEIENFSSKFLNNLIDPKKRDIFKIGSINIGQKNSSFEVQITQQSIHPHSLGGFHLSAVPVCEFIDAAIRKIVKDDLVLDIQSFEILCKKGIRKKTLKPVLYLTEESLHKINGTNFKVLYDLENSSFKGSINYRSYKIEESNKGLNENIAPLNKFEILDYKVDGLKTDVSMNFSGNTLSLDGYVLGPGLALAICSQLVIVHIYYLSNLKKKSKGVVVKNYKFQCIKNIKSNQTVSYKSCITNVKKGMKYIEVDVQCSFNNDSVIADLTYYFDPLS